MELETIMGNLEERVKKTLKEQAGAIESRKDVQETLETLRGLERDGVLPKKQYSLPPSQVGRHGTIQTKTRAKQ
jgi:hypothetical protein